MKLTSHLVTIGLRFCGIAVLALWVAAGEAESSAAYQQEMDELLARLDKLKSRLSEQTRKQGRLQQTIRNTETEIGALVQDRRELEKQQRAIRKELTALEQKQQALQMQIDAQKLKVSEHLLKIYQSENRNPVQLLLENGNPADIDRQLDYLERINRARHELLQNYSDLLRQQQATIDKVQASQAAIASYQRKLASREQELAALQDKRKSNLQQITAAIGSDRETLGQLEQDRDALQQLLEGMAEAMQQAPDMAAEFPDDFPHYEDFAAARGRLPWPARGKLARHRDQRWQGVNIGAGEGDDVKAIFPGRVLFADWFTGQGLLLIIDHGEGYWSLYGHNQSLLKAEGDSVIAGEIIATVGNSGGQSQPGLYFEIRHNGKPHNPREWCRSAG